MIVLNKKCILGGRSLMIVLSKKYILGGRSLTDDRVLMKTIASIPRVEVAEVFHKSCQCTHNDGLIKHTLL